MTWRVLRRDDNGNTYVVAEDLEESVARARLEELERRAHKQSYWIEPVPRERERGRDS